MRKLLLTLFYHPQEHHATTVCRKLEQEKLNGSVIPYRYSSYDGHPPDPHLKQGAIAWGCSHILTIHSDSLEPFEYGVFIFSSRKKYYERIFNKLLRRFDKGAYGFDEPDTQPVQIDLELGEHNDVEHSIAVVKGLVHLLV